MFTLNKKNYLCIIDYHGKFPIIKKTKDLSADSLIFTYKVIFLEYGIPKRKMSDAGGNFVSEKFKNFCKSLNIEQAVSLSCHHLSNGQVEVCINFLKHTLKKCFESRSDLHIPLLQIRTTLLGQVLPSPTTML